MRLPEHLDYDEVSDGETAETSGDWWPEVYCKVVDCRWTYDASWDDLADDGGTDWHALHPAHP